MLCHAFGQEYMRAHRAFSLLARRLATLGYPVLRFDFYGCGDSSGDALDGNLQRWTQNVGSAIDEVKNAGRVARVALVGLRLGASLAAAAAAGRDDVGALVAWDPIIRGQDYLDDLRTAHHSWMEAVEPGSAVGDLEALGFPISEELSQQLGLLDLNDIETPPNAALLVVEEDQGNDTSGLVEKQRASGRRIDVRQGAGDALGATPTNLGKPWLPIQTIQTMASWLPEACS